VLNFVSHPRGRIQIEGVSEQAPEENMELRRRSNKRLEVITT
jgi:hypothetical protein